MNQEKIGKFISEKRKEQKLTQEQLAGKVNVSKNAVSKWERGLNLPDVSIMQELCKILKISLNELFAGEVLKEKEIVKQSEKTIIDIIKFNSNKRKKFKMITVIFLIVLIILLGRIFLMEKQYVTNSEECCYGCMCGDTIELIKNIENAWSSVTINSEGEYVYNSNAFINFNGTGKDAYALFWNDGRPDEYGKYIIDKDDRVILVPNEKDAKITCVIGEEIDLLAIISCDKNYGLFALQKEGKLNIPSEMSEIIKMTKTIIVGEYMQLDNDIENYGYKQIKSITNQKEINKFITVINKSKVWKGMVTLPMPKYEIKLLNNKNEQIAIITYSPNFNIEINNKSYYLADFNTKTLNEIIK